MRSDQWPRRAKSLHRNFVQKIITSNQCNTTTCASLRICLAGEMKRNHPHADNTPPHFRTVIPSENGGSGHRSKRECRPIGGHGGTAPTAVCVSQTAVVAHDVQPLPLCSGWTSKHEKILERDKKFYERQSIATGRPWTLEADKYTRKVLADCPERTLDPSTANEYRKIYQRLVDEGLTAWEKCNSVQHWNKLRTACRWTMADDIRRFRGMSEVARKSGDIATAQRYTMEAWKLSVALDAQFLTVGHQTWSDKLRWMKSNGLQPVNKSKRNTTAPDVDVANGVLLDNRHRGTQLLQRHSERLAVLALTGCRPAELMKGVVVRLLRDKNGQPKGVGIEISGAKVDDHRGHKKRRLAFLLSGGLTVRALSELCTERGGQFTLSTTNADYRSLNRLLNVHNMSCYTFRHALGSDLKASIADGQITPEQAAKVMGHRSTQSLLSYGTTHSGRSRRRPKMEVGASNVVKKAPVGRVAKSQAKVTKAALKSTPKATSKAVLVEASPHFIPYPKLLPKFARKGTV